MRPPEIQGFEPRISRAVVTPDTRGARPPGITAPPPPRAAPKRHNIGLTEVVVGAGVVATVGAAVAVGVNFLRQQGQKPDQTPLPGGIVEPSNTPIPTPISTENPTVTLPPSPTPKTTPTPTPEVTPSPEPPPTPEVIPNIEDVKLVSEGVIERNFYNFHIYSSTVVAVEKNPDGTVRSFTVTTKGSKITKTCADIANAPTTFCSYEGLTIKIVLTERTYFLDENNSILGKGPEDISEYIERGHSIPHLQMLTRVISGVPDDDVAGNLKAVHAIDNNVGEELSRQEQSELFEMYPISVYKP